MKSQSNITAVGIVKSRLPEGRFLVVLDNGHCMVAWLEKTSDAPLMVGSRLTLKVNPYNMSRSG
jgi:hypothetical protein